MITLHEEERAGQTLPEYRERVIIESETASLASDLQPLPYDSATEDFVDTDQSVKAEACGETQGILISHGSMPRKDSTLGNSFIFCESDRHIDPLEGSHHAEKKKFDVAMHVRDFKEYIDGEPMEGVNQIETRTHSAESSRKEVLQESTDVDMTEETNEGMKCIRGSIERVEENVLGDKNTGIGAARDSEGGSGVVEMELLPENVPKIINCKRKHNMTPEGVHRQTLKSPKGDMTSDIDNSSDSGISGDLAEDVELHINSPNPSSPCQKEIFTSNRGLTIEEVVTENSNNEDSENEYFVSLVHKVFGGKLATCIKCLQCKTESIHKDVFTDIHLAFQDTDRYNAASAIRRNPDRMCRQKHQQNPADLSIEDMITSYLTSEKLTGENQYECERCGGKQDAERSIQILEPPEHLILTQLRFYYDTARGQRQKVFTNVEFGEELLLPIRYSTQGFLGDNITSRCEGAVGGAVDVTEVSAIADENRKPTGEPTETSSGLDSLASSGTSVRHNSQASCSISGGTNVGASCSTSSDHNSQCHCGAVSGIYSHADCPTCNGNNEEASCSSSSGRVSQPTGSSIHAVCSSSEASSSDPQFSCSSFQVSCSTSQANCSSSNSQTGCSSVQATSSSSQASSNSPQATSESSQATSSTSQASCSILHATSSTSQASCSTSEEYCSSSQASSSSHRNTKGRSKASSKSSDSTGRSAEATSSSPQAASSSSCDSSSSCRGSLSRPKDSSYNEHDLSNVSSSYSASQPSCSYSTDFTSEASCSYSSSDSSQTDFVNTVLDDSHLSSGSSLQFDDQWSSQKSPQPSCSYTPSTNLPKEDFVEYPISSGSSDCMTSKDECEEEQEVTYARYALYGVVVHSGFSSEGGHYYCYARNSSIASLPESARER